MQSCVLEALRYLQRPLRWECWQCFSEVAGSFRVCAQWSPCVCVFMWPRGTNVTVHPRLQLVSLIERELIRLSGAQFSKNHMTNLRS